MKTIEALGLVDSSQVDIKYNIYKTKLQNFLFNWTLFAHEEVDEKLTELNKRIILARGKDSVRKLYIELDNINAIIDFLSFLKMELSKKQSDKKLLQALNISRTRNPKSF